MANLLNLALSALDRGWSIVPIKCVYDEVKKKVKKPATVKWLPYRDEKVKKSYLLNQWRDKLVNEPGLGYAVICGEISNLFVVDVDTEEARKVAERLMGDCETYTVATPGGGYHYYFQHTDGFANRASIGVKGLDYRTYGGYVVGHGSTYPDGRPYRIVKDLEIKRIPDQLRDFLFENSKDPQTRKEDGTFGEKPKENRDWYTDILRDGFQEGQRIDQLKRVIGLMVGEGKTHEHIRIMVDMINQKSKDPLPQKELEDQSRMMIKNFRGREEAIQGEVEDRFYKFNEEYAQITIGGKPMILRFKKDPINGEEDFDLIQPLAMRTETRHIVEWVGKNRFFLSQLWEESPLRRRYQEVIFDPSLPPQTGFEHGENGPYNMWRGFTVNPKEGDWSLFRNHLTKVLAPGYGDYILKWLARMFQDPGGRKPGKVLVFRGKPGTGKSFARRVIGYLFGRHYYKTDDIQHLIGRFNNAVSNVIFLALEEAMWAGDRSQVGKLKDRITSHTLSIEKKGIEIITIANHLNIWMNSNEKWVVPIQDHDRRFVVFDVDDTYINDIKHFKRIQEQMDNGGYQAMLYDLLHLPWTMEDLIQSPKTAAGFDQYTRENSPIKRFVHNLLVRGTLHPIHKGWKTYVLKDKLYEYFESFCNRQRYNYKDSYIDFSRDLGKYLLHEKIRKRFGPLIDGARERIYAIKVPSLEACREYFSEEYDVEWEDPDIIDRLSDSDREIDLLDDYEIHLKEPF